MDSVISWFVLMFGGGLAVAMLLYRLYEHDYKKTERKNNFDIWG